MKKNTRFKLFCQMSINDSLVFIEQEINRQKKTSYYIEIDKLRYVRISSMFNCISNYKNCNLKLLVLFSINKIIKLFFLVLSGKVVKFYSTADILHIRNNLSVFYLDDMIRFKFFISGGVRGPENIKNEIAFFKKNQNTKLNLVMPRLLNKYDKNGFLGYSDSVILGRPIDWSSKESNSMTKSLLNIMLNFYADNGVEWCSIKERFPVLYQELVDKSQFDRGNILEILEKKIACSIIHGDLSLGNTLMDNAGKFYIIDWELSVFGSIVYDLVKVIAHKPFTMEIVESFINENIDRSKLNSSNVSSLSEQFKLAKFIKKNKIVWREG